MRQAAWRLAETPEDIERMYESMQMRRAIYPRCISKELVFVKPLPEGCLVVEDEEDAE